VAATGAGDAAVDQVVHASVAPALVRMATEAGRLENSVVNATAAGGGEPAAQILEERRQTGAELLDAVARSEAVAVEGGRLRMTCAERARLVAELAGWGKGGADEFTVAAGLMLESLKRVEWCAAG
jgi:hypothetical protein